MIAAGFVEADATGHPATVMVAGHATAEFVSPTSADLVAASTDQAVLRCGFSAIKSLDPARADRR